MTLIVFFQKKFLPSFLIWLVGYIAIEKLLRKFLPQVVEKIDWSALLEINTAACVVIGGIAVIIIGWIVAKTKGEPIFQMAREEVASAFLSLSAIALVSGIFGPDLRYFLCALLGYGIAWRLL